MSADQVDVSKHLVHAVVSTNDETTRVSKLITQAVVSTNDEAIRVTKLLVQVVVDVAPVSGVLPVLNISQ